MLTWLVFLHPVQQNTIHCMGPSGIGSSPVHMLQPIHSTIQLNLLWKGSSTSWWTQSKTFKTTDQTLTGAASIWGNGSMNALNVRKTISFIQYPNAGRTACQYLPYQLQGLFPVFHHDIFGIKGVAGFSQWILDSGATSSCTSDLSVFTSLSSNVPFSRIRVANAAEYVLT